MLVSEGVSFHILVRTMVRDARLLVVTHSSFQMVQVSFSGNKRCQEAALIRIEIVLRSHAF